MLERTEVKKATRNMFYDEHGKHVRTKKEILDENGEIRKGCFVIAKGETYDIKWFAPKEQCFKSRSFLPEIKNFMTERINMLIQNEEEKLQVFDPNGPSLATKELAELMVQRSNKSAEIDQIVRKAKYKNVDKFMKAYNNSTRIVEEYLASKEQNDSEKKESVVARIKQLQTEVKTSNTEARDVVKNKRSKETER